MQHAQGSSHVYRGGAWSLLAADHWLVQVGVARTTDVVGAIHMSSSLTSRWPCSWLWPVSMLANGCGLRDRSKLQEQL